MTGLLNCGERSGKGSFGGMKSSSYRPGQAAVFGLVNGPSPEREATARLRRRTNPLAGGEQRRGRRNFGEVMRCSA